MVNLSSAEIGQICGGCDCCHGNRFANVVIFNVFFGGALIMVGVGGIVAGAIRDTAWLYTAGGVTLGIGVADEVLNCIMNACVVLDADGFLQRNGR